MPTLGEFNTLLRDTVRLGTRVDSLILASVRQAVLWLERNYDFRYMKQEEVQFYNPTTARGPYALANVPKVVRSVGTYESPTDLTKIYWMQRVQDKDVDNYPTERPLAYYVKNNSIYLNAVPDAVYYGVVNYFKYSTFPAITTSNMYSSTDPSLWLVTYGEDLLLQQALMMLAIALKDVELGASARALRDEALRTLLLAEDEFTYSDEDATLAYRGSYNG